MQNMQLLGGYAEVDDIYHAVSVTQNCSISKRAVILFLCDLNLTEGTISENPEAKYHFISQYSFLFLNVSKRSGRRNSAR